MQEPVARQPQQIVEQSLAPTKDSLLLAVLSIESATTAEEQADSIRRLHSLGLPEVQATATPEPTATPAPEACVDDGDAFCVYTVVQGDTLSGIATRLGFTGNASLSAAEMLAQSNKPDVVSSDHIEPGQHLRIPKETGILHTAFSAETVSEIAGKYGVTADDIIASPYNDLGPNATVQVGQHLLVPDPAHLPASTTPTLNIDNQPGETPVPEEEEPTEEPEPTATPVPPTGTPSPASPALASTRAAATATATPTRRPQATPKPGSSFFVWPVEGPISSYFGPSHPLGIDIDLYNDPNARINAARGGTVTFAGGDVCCSYGLYVIIDHGNGLTTLYGHLSKISVSVGQKVNQGQKIGEGGKTGYATGNHLHFEMRLDGNVMDPLLYLP
jgi:murein DD-endopeptidase MepM/ murein hydrolase activator NlpD